MKNRKRNITMVAVLLFVCAAVTLNWSYNQRWGKPDAEMVQAMDEARSSAEAASQETIDSAMNAISVMAASSMKESQLENLLLAKGFADCVVYIGSGSVTVAVPAPSDGLSEESVARITEVVCRETEFEASQLSIIEVRA